MKQKINWHLNNQPNKVPELADCAHAQLGLPTHLIKSSPFHPCVTCAQQHKEAVWLLANKERGRHKVRQIKPKWNATTTFEPEISITQLNSCSRARTGSCNKTIIPLSLIDLCVNTVTRPMESYIKQYKLLIHGVYLELNMPSLHFGFNLFFSTYTTTNTRCPIPKVEGTGCDGHGVWCSQVKGLWDEPFLWTFASWAFPETRNDLLPVQPMCFRNVQQILCSVFALCSYVILVSS